MKVCLSFIALLFAFSCPVLSQTTEEVYTRTITERAGKIVSALSISDSFEDLAVKKLVANQYRNLNDIQTARDSRIQELKISGKEDKNINTEITNIRSEADAKIAVLHQSFLQSLAKHLTSDQIDQIKDGMTYNVVHVTYKAYVDMIPSLTEKQKAQMMAWLIEAREHAMDAENSAKKHAWFGKYKGRINNYLSAEGYDIRKEREAWNARQK